MAEKNESPTSRVEHQTVFSRRVAKLAEIIEYLGITKPTLYEYMRDQGFPRPLRLGGSSVRGARLWYADEVEAWLDSRNRGGE